MRRVLPLVLASAALLPACGGGDGDGSLTITVSGGDYALHGIPGAAFSDGWDVAFTLVLVTVGGVEVVPAGDAPLLAAPGYQIFDLHKPADAPLAIARFPDVEGSYTELRYVVRPDAAAVSANAGSDAVSLRNSGNSLRVKGTAAKGEQLIWFDWTFAKDVTHARCDLTDTPSELEVSVHPEQLFVDDLVAATPQLAFELIASADGADGTNLDGTVTLEELAAKPIDGQSRYQVGGLPIGDLRAFVTHQAGTLGRFNGDGRCLAVVDAAP